MRVKTLCSVMSAVAGLVLSSVASADEPAAGGAPAAGAPTEPPPVAAATGTAAGASDSKMKLALNFVPMPFLGKLKASAGGVEISNDAAFAFGIMPVFDYLVSSNFFVGAAPMYTFNVKGKDVTGDAAKQLDLMLRVGGLYPVADKLQVYGYLSPGYSIVMPPEGDSAKGLAIGFHAGAAFDVAPNFFVNGQLGYQLGFQSVQGVDFKTSYFQVGLGGGIRL